MRNKVEITGINTADLKTIPNEEMMELIKKSQEGDFQARDDLVYGNLKLVLSVIKKFNNRGENLDDLFQVGCLGLLKAIDNFDFSHGVKFSTYAVPMIIGEIRRYLRDNSKIRISRSLKDLAYKALQFKERYTNEHSAEPPIELIAEHLGVEVIDIVIALEAIQEPISIYTPIYNNGGDEIYLIDQIADNTNNEDKKILSIMIEDGFKKLNKRLRSIIYDRYYLGKTQMEIAEEIGISQAQVSRLEKSALKIMFGDE
jgi:RNA polymerase sporulation-specific sigma factor